MIRRAMPLPDRRATLAHLARWAAVLAAGRVFAAPDTRLPVMDRPAFGADPFALGVASGQPRPHDVVIWTRLMGDPAVRGGRLPHALLPVTWEMADDPEFREGLRRGTVLADPHQGHSLRVRVEGLAPDRHHYYRFRCGDATSPVGRTRTAPRPDAEVERLRFALASCQHYEQGWFIPQREIATQDIDFVLFVGDYIYDTSNRRYRIRAHEADLPFTLDQFRARYAHYRRDPDLRAAHAAHPWIVAWDDHEVRNDYAGRLGDEDLSPAKFLELRTTAYQVYFEHLPLAPDQRPTRDGMRMHDRYAWGRLADLWTLDGRQHRSLQACNAAADGTAGGHLRWRCEELGDTRRSLLGMRQEGWLAEGLRGSTARWKLVGQCTQISAWGIPGPGGRRVIFTDGWDGYPVARARMLQDIADHRVDNVVFLGGDVHRHVAAVLRPRPNDPASPAVATEFVTSSLTTAGMPEAAMSLIRRSNPDILHARSDERGYMLFDVTPGSLHCVARATGFPVLPHAQMATQARFRVDAGRVGPQRA